MFQSGQYLCLRNLLTKVDNLILKLSSAFWLIALPPCKVLSRNILGPSSEVSQIASVAGLALLQVCVPMHLSEVIDFNPRLKMQPIGILAHDMFEQSFLLHRENSHVSQTGYRLLGLHSMNVHLSPHDLRRPFVGAGARFEDRSVGTPIVRDSS